MNRSDWHDLLYKKEITRKQFLGIGAVGFASLFGITSVVRELSSRAASIPASTEAESGSKSGALSVLGDSSASGGAAIQLGRPVSAAPSNVPRVIFDSDMSSDWDDVGDAAVLHGLALLGECEIIGMAVSSTDLGGAIAMDIFNTYYGKPDIPIAVRPDVLGIGGYGATLFNEFPHSVRVKGDCMLAVDMYRKLLAASPNNSVIIVTAGYLNNIQALMQSGPDQYSPLSGMDLIRQKVRLWACAGGTYPGPGGEFNFAVEPLAAKYAVNNWPVAATYVPDNVGRYYYTAGTLPFTPSYVAGSASSSPIRRVYVDIKKHYPYPSWTQVGIYQAIRGNTALLGEVTNGKNMVINDQGINQWITTVDPSGGQEQTYIVPRARTPLIDGINGAMTVLPPTTAVGLNVPGAPSDLKATVLTAGQVKLDWVRNSYNETGFVIEQRTAGNNYSRVGSVAAGVTSFTVNGLSTTNNTGFRVKAINNAGSSYVFSHVWLYSGWTENNLHSPGQNLPLYLYHQTCHLRWNRGPDYTPNHIVINNDSDHGKNITVNVKVARNSAYGALYVYFLYTDTYNWYRLHVHSTTGANDPDTNKIWFEKSVNGTVSRLHTPIDIPAGLGLANGAPMQQWNIIVTETGVMRYMLNGTELINTTSPLSLSSGKVAVGGVTSAPIWEDVNFY